MGLFKKWWKKSRKSSQQSLPVVEDNLPKELEESRRYPTFVLTGKPIIYCFILLIGFDFVMTYTDLIITRYLSNSEFAYVSKFSWLIRLHQIKTWTFFVSLFAIVVAGLTDSFTTLLTTTIVGIGVTVIMFLIAFLAEFTSFPEEIKALIFLIGKYFTVFTLIFLPIRTVFILEQIILPEDLVILRPIIIIFIWLRQVDTILVALIPEILKEEHKILLMNTICVPLIVAFGIAIVLFHKRLIKYDKINTFIVYKCIWDAVAKMVHKNKVSREKKWILYAKQHPPLIQNTANQYVLLLCWLTPFIAYFMLEQLLHHVWDIQVKLIDLSPDSIFPALSLKVILAVMNMINIPLLELLFFFCNETKFLHNDLQRMCIAFFALVCSTMIALWLEVISDKPPMFSYGSAELNLYNTMNSIVEIDSVWTGKQSMEPATQMTFPVSGIGDLHTMVNISNKKEGFHMRDVKAVVALEMRNEYAKTIFAREDASVFYVISNLGIIRITGFENRESEGLDEPDLGVAKIIVLSTIFWGVQFTPYLHLEGHETIWIKVPRVIEKFEYTMKPGNYTIFTDLDKGREESRYLAVATYVIIFYNNMDDQVDFQVYEKAAAKEKYDHPKITYLALYFFSLAISIHSICLKNLAFLESPLDVRCTSFAMLQFFQVFGSSTFFVLNWLWKGPSFKFLICLCLFIYIVNIGLLILVMKKFKQQQWLYE